MAMPKVHMLHALCLMPALHSPRTRGGLRHLHPAAPICSHSLPLTHFSLHSLAMTCLNANHVLANPPSLRLLPVTVQVSSLPPHCQQPTPPTFSSPPRSLLPAPAERVPPVTHANTAVATLSLHMGWPPWVLWHQKLCVVLPGCMAAGSGQQQCRTLQWSVQDTRRLQKQLGLQEHK